jgi:hypothetical protein
MMIIPANEVPADMDYQLIAVSVCGDRTMSQLATYEKTGWRRVPNTRHPYIRSDDKVWLEQGGLAFVERPKYLTERAKEFEKAKADAQLIAVIGNMTAANREPFPEWDGPVRQSTLVRSTQRPLDPKAPKKAAKRKQNICEFATLHTWRFRNWLGNKWAGRK